MHKEVVTYTDYNGVEKTGEYFFNLNKAELLKLENSVQGGFTAMVQRAINADNQPEVFAAFEDLIRRSYGVKTLDGSGFVKRQEDYDAFVATEAYSELFWKLATDAEAGSAFVNGIIPANLAKQIEEMAEH